MSNLAVRGTSDPDPIDLDALNPPKVVEGTVISVRATPLPVPAVPPRATRPVPPRAVSTESLIPVTLAFLALLFWFGLCLSIIWGVL